MPDISEIFGGEKLSYEEFLAKAGEMGVEVGDTTELKQQYEAEIMSVRTQNEIERELEKAGAKDRELVMKLIDMQSVTFDEESIHGIAEQIDVLKANAAYLFEDKQQSKAAVPKMRIGMPHKSEANDADSMNDKDYYKRVKKM